MNHRERMEACLAEGKLDRPPVALWRHFPVDDQVPERLAEATLDFQRSYDFDFVKVTPSSSYCLKDWGAQDEWRGAPEGTRAYTRRVVKNPEDWGSLSDLAPDQGHLGGQLTCLKSLIAALGPDVPVIQTIFNPLSQAKNLAGEQRMLVHMRQHPEAFLAGLNRITENTIRFIRAAQEVGVAGLFYAVQHARFAALSEAEYREFGRRYDLQLLDAASDLWLNVLHLHGREVMFDLLADYPVQVINWHDQETPPTLAEAQKRFPGVVCGGLSRREDMVLGTPEQVRSRARDAMERTAGKRFVLGTGCVTPTTAPRANLLAARSALESDASR